MNQHCVHCGSLMEPNTQSCTACGATITAAQPPHTVQQPVAPGYAVQQPMPYAAPPVVLYGQPVYAAQAYAMPLQYQQPQYAPLMQQYAAQPDPYVQPAQQYQNPSVQYASPVQQYAVQPDPYAQPAQQYQTLPVQYAPPVQQYAAQPDSYAQPAQQYQNPPVQYAPPVQQYEAPPIPYAMPPIQQYAPQPSFYSAQQGYYAPVYIQQKPLKRKKQKEFYDDSHLPLYGVQQVQPVAHDLSMPFAQYAADSAQTQQPAVSAQSIDPVSPVDGLEVSTLQEQTAAMTQTGANVLEDMQPASPNLEADQIQPVDAATPTQPLEPVGPGPAVYAQQNAQSTQQAATQPPYVANIGQVYPAQTGYNMEMPLYGLQPEMIQPQAPSVYGIPGELPKQKKPKRERQPLFKKNRAAQAQSPYDNTAAATPICETTQPQPAQESVLPVEQMVYGTIGKPPKQKKQKSLFKKDRTAQAPQPFDSVAMPVYEPVQPQPDQAPMMPMESAVEMQQYEGRLASQTNGAQPVVPAVQDEAQVAHGQNESEASFNAVKAQFDSIED